jgi:phosphonate transport system substrate-binding protein
MPFVRIALLLAGLAAVVVGAAGAQDKPLAFGVLNQQSPVRTAERWNPILQYVSKVSGVPLQLRMGPTVQDTNAMMGRGELDFVFTNHNFQSEYASIGFVVIARWAGDPIHGVIAVPADSPIQSLAQLAGRRVAFPSRDAFVAYAVPTLALKEAGVAVEEVMAANQEGALAQLKARRVDAAAVNSRFLSQYAEREGLEVRTIFVSAGFPDLAVIAHPRVPRAVVDKVRRALIGMRTDPDAATLLAQAGSKGFESATDRDYDGVRRVYRQIGQ